MCSQQTEISLSQTDCYRVVWCVGCQCYRVSIGDLSWKFNECDINSFQRLLTQLTPSHFHYYLRPEPQVLIRHLPTQAGIFITQAEVDDLRRIIAEAKMMKEVYQILNP